MYIWPSIRPHLSLSLSRSLSVVLSVVLSLFLSLPPSFKPANTTLRNHYPGTLNTLLPGNKARRRGNASNVNTLATEMRSCTALARCSWNDICILLRPWRAGSRSLWTIGLIFKDISSATFRCAISSADGELCRTYYGLSLLGWCSVDGNENPHPGLSKVSEWNHDVRVNCINIYSLSRHVIQSDFIQNERYMSCRRRYSSGMEED